MLYAHALKLKLQAQRPAGATMPREGGATAEGHTKLCIYTHTHTHTHTHTSDLDIYIYQ